MATQTQPHDDAGLGAKLAKQGLKPTGEVHWNLVAPALIQTAIRRGEGELETVADALQAVVNGDSGHGVLLFPFG